MASTVNEMIGHWIQPWPGESLLGEVIAISGDSVVCRARNGLRFEVSMRATLAGQVIEISQQDSRMLNGRFRWPARSMSGYKLTSRALATS